MSIESRLRSTDVLALAPDAALIEDEQITARALLERMREHGKAYALLTKNGKLSGILTERDFFRHFVPDEAGLDRPTSASMTPDPVRVLESDTIATVVGHMTAGHFRHVVVTDDSGAVVGCVDHSHVVAYLGQYYADRILNRPPNPDQLATTPDGA